MGLDEDRAVVRKIRTLLKAYPKGLIITEIAQRLKINRNSAAKYLEILLFTGQVEVRQIGMAKVYTVSQRVSLSGLLQFAQEQILVVDDEGRIVQANDPLLRFWKVSRDDLLGEPLNRIEVAPLKGLTLPPSGGQAEAQRQELAFEYDGRTVYCRLSMIPTVFEDGGSGCTLIIEDVTAEREYERQLAESQERYRAVVEDQTELITRHRPDGALTFANVAWRRFFGVEPDDDLAWVDLGSCVSEEELRAIREREQALTPEAPCTHFTQQVTDASGEMRWVEGTQRALFDSHGTVIEYQSVARDVTEVQARQRELLVKESAIAASIDGMAIVGPDERFEYVNRAFASIFGYRDPSEITGQEFTALAQGDVPTALLFGEVKTALTREGRWSGELRCLRRDGHSLTAQVSASTVFDETGAFLCVLLSVVDVTERRLTEEALKRSHEKLQETIEFIPDATFIVNRERQVIAWNRSMETMTGLDRESLIGTRNYGLAFAGLGGTFPVLVDLLDLSSEELARAYAGVRRFGDVLYYETWVPSLHGGRGGYLWGKASPLADRDGTLIGAIQTLRDITDWKRAEESYRDAFRRDERSRRLEELSGDRVSQG